MKIIKAENDIILFFLTLGNEGIPFHPDKPFAIYKDAETGLARYTEKEIRLRETILADCFDFCKKNSLDTYAIYRSVYGIDAEARMKNYLPALFSLLDNRKLDWPSINKKLQKEFDNRLQQQTKGKTLFKANLYDIIIAATKRNKSAEGLLHYFQQLLTELNQHLGTEDKPKIHDTLFGMLIELDLNYYNYVAELSVLNVFLKSNMYALAAIETPLGNGNSADFLLKKIDSDKTEAVEVVSIRPDTFPASDEKIVALIEQKIREKILKKTNGDPQYLTFALVPVFWGSVQELRKIAALMKEKKISFGPNVMALCAYCTFSSEDGAIKDHFFGFLSDMFINAPSM